MEEQDKPAGLKFAQNFSTEQYFPVTVQAGQSIGLLLVWTYPQTFTVVTSRH